MMTSFKSYKHVNFTEKLASFALVMSLTTATLIFGCLSQAQAGASQPASSKGVYIKVEGGYSISQKENFKVDSPYSGWDGVNPADPNFKAGNDDFKGRIGNSALYGFGLGYRFNDMFRADLSYHQRDNFKYEKIFSGVVDNTTGIPYSYDRTHNMKSKTLTLNGYVDLARVLCLTHSFVSPYVGAGLGVSWNTLRDAVTVRSNALNAFAAETFAPINSKTKTSFTWNVTLGSTFKVSRNFDIDFGYRFADLGKFESGTRAADFVGDLTPMKTSHTYTHEIYLGLRIPV